MNRPRLLDLFCKAGGASAGYYAAGFDVVGVDIEPQPDYPFEFIRANALTVDLTGFEVITASPPCQKYSVATPAQRRDEHHDLIAPTRTRLHQAVATPGGPWAYVIENVPGAPLLNPVLVCGDTLRLGVRRHRLFESNLPLHGTGCHHDRQTPPVPVYGSYGQRTNTSPDGHHTEYARAAMGIDWMPWPALTQAIPPPYTHWLGVQLLNHRPTTVNRDECRRRAPLSPRDGTRLVASVSGSDATPPAGFPSLPLRHSTSSPTGNRSMAPLLLPRLPPSRLPRPTHPEVSMTSPLRLVEPAHLTDAALLDAVTGFVSRFIVFPHQHCAPMLALWYAHTHAAEHFYVTPRLVISSAEPGSGKTLVIEVGQYLVAKPEMVLSASPAAIFRMVAANGPITLLWDEVDTVFTASGNTNDELRGLLNNGYKRTSTIPRCVGEGHAVQRFPVYSPVALVGLAGGMPPTITTRAITIHMRRKKREDKAEEFRERIVSREAEPLREALAAWIGGIGESLGEAEPAMPPGVACRSREIWEPLLAIADAAGGHWPHTARNACSYFVRVAEEQPVTIGVRLLSDLRAVFADRDTDRLATMEILSDLLALDEAPWGDINGGRPIDARRLARELALYHVAPVPFRTHSGITKGYVTYANNNQLGLADAWSRYLPTTDDEGEDSWDH